MVLDADAFRSDRHKASYSARVDDARMRAQLAELHANLSRLLPLVREWLVANRPAIADSLPPPT